MSHRSWVRAPQVVHGYVAINDLLLQVEDCNTNPKDCDRNRQRGGIEPLCITAPRELKSRPSTSLTHPGPVEQNFAFEPQVAGSIPVACLLHNVKILLAENLGLLLAQSLYSSVVERQSCKLKVLGSIPSGGLCPP